MTMARERCSGVMTDFGALEPGSEGAGAVWCGCGKSQGGRATQRTPRKATRLHKASFQVKGSRSQMKQTIAVVVGIRKVITVASEISSQERESGSCGLVCYLTGRRELSWNSADSQYSPNNPIKPATPLNINSHLIPLFPKGKSGTPLLQEYIEQMMVVQNMRMKMICSA